MSSRRRPHAHDGRDRPHGPSPLATITRTCCSSSSAVAQSWVMSYDTIVCRRRRAVHAVPAPVFFFFCLRERGSLPVLRPTAMVLVGWWGRRDLPPPQLAAATVWCCAPAFLHHSLSPSSSCHAIPTTGALTAERLQMYCVQRELLVVPVARARIAAVMAGKDLAALLRSGAALALRLSEDEASLYSHFFAESGDDLPRLLRAVCRTMLDTVRPHVMHIESVEVRVAGKRRVGATDGLQGRARGHGARPAPTVPCNSCGRGGFALPQSTRITQIVE